MDGYRVLMDRARKNLELAKRYRKEKNFEVAILLYSKALESTLRAMYKRSKGKYAPKSASLQYIANATELPKEVEDYIISVTEPKVGRNGDAFDVLDMNVTKSSMSLYMDGLAKYMLDYAASNRN